MAQNRKVAMRQAIEAAVDICLGCTLSLVVDFTLESRGVHGPASQIGFEQTRLSEIEENKNLSSPEVSLVSARSEVDAVYHDAGAVLRHEDIDPLGESQQSFGDRSDECSEDSADSADLRLQPGWEGDVSEAVNSSMVSPGHMHVLLSNLP